MNRDLELLYELGALRQIKRAWVQYNNQDFANLAEHHMRICWIALILAGMEKNPNTDKILKMALIHDVPESRTGDVHHISRLYTQRNEHGALKEILKNTSLEQEMFALWEEYEKKESHEAKIVKDADMLDVDLEILEQGAKGSPLKEVWERTRKEHIRPNLLTASGKKLFELIWNSDPYDWVKNAPNRFEPNGSGNGNSNHAH